MDGAQGLHLHSSLALTVQGVPLGFVDAQCWARDAQEFGKKAQRSSLPIEDKESGRWIKAYQALRAVQKRNPQVQLVSLGDREADIYELFEEALRESDNPKLLVRARHDRKVQDEQQRLFQTIQAKPVAGWQSVRLPQQKRRPARVAKLALRFASLTLCPPKTKPQLGPIEVQMVLAQEEDAPAGGRAHRVGVADDAGGGQLRAGLREGGLVHPVPDLLADVYFDHDECQVLIAYEARHRKRPRTLLRRLCAKPYAWSPSWAGSLGASPMANPAPRRCGAGCCAWMA